MSALLRQLNKYPPAAVVRCIHLSSIKNKGESTYEKFTFNMAGFNKYGLLRDDTHNEFYNKDIKEAVRRLPEEMQMQRLYRVMRAQQLYESHSILPEDQWTKIDEDHDYLQPYLKEVIAEREEREEWEANH